MRRSLATTLALVPWLASPAIAATFVVDSTADAVDATPGDGLCASVLAGSPCTLRAAVQEANALPGEDLVLLPAGAFALALPGAQEEDAATGDLDVVEALRIEGVGEGLSVLDGAALDRVLDLRPGGGSLSLRGLTLTGGRPPLADAFGGCLRVAAATAATLREVTFTGCAAEFGGGAIVNAGTLEGLEVTFASNGLPQFPGPQPDGGAILDLGPNATLSLRRCAFAGNLGQNGGAIYASGDFGQPEARAAVTVEACSFSGNQATQIGGAVHANAVADLLFTNVTFSGNSAGLGGAVGNDGGCFITLRHATITGNSAQIGGGIGEVHFAPQFIELDNSILVGNSATSFGPDCNRSLHSVGGSLIGDLTDCVPVLTPSDWTGVAPLLGPLAPAAPGERSLAHAPLAGSPLVDSAVGASCAAGDQRDLPRPQDGDGDLVAACDRGAFESLPGLVFHDAFESGATAHWSETVATRR